MKQYLEAWQQVYDDIAPDFARIEIEGDKDLAGMIPLLEAIMVDSKPYRMFRHYCGHEDGKPCPPLELIKEVS